MVNYAKPELDGSEWSASELEVSPETGEVA
jgi:hypothetical protein